MIPLSGPITSAMLRAELGITGPVTSLASHAGFRRAAAIPTGTIKASDLRGAHVLLAGTSKIAVDATQTVFGIMGSPSVASSRYRLIIELGATLGSAYPASNAAGIGQFPAGSTVTVDIYGMWGGAGGRKGVLATADGQGGCACYGQYANQTMVVNLKPSGQFFGGGGSGGPGGNGGPGGYGGSLGGQIGGQNGFGGAGGMWGKGEGTDGPRTLGGQGSVGSGGFPGISPGGGLSGSSGAGGAGGNGGKGGDGGGFGSDGQSGTAGQRGYDGQPATDGSPGGPGIAGSAGGSGGSKGYYLYKGTGNLTFNNQGGVAAGLLG